MPKENFKLCLVKSPCNILGLGCRIPQVLPWRIRQPNPKMLHRDLTMWSLKFSFDILKLHPIYCNLNIILMCFKKNGKIDYWVCNFGRIHALLDINIERKLGGGGRKISWLQTSWLNKAPKFLHIVISVNQFKPVILMWFFMHINFVPERFVLFPQKMS